MGSSITFASGVAISKDNFYTAVALDELDHWDYFSRMFIYRHNDEDDWTYHDLDGWGMVSTAFKEIGRELLTLNCDGDIEIFTPGNQKYETIIPEKKDHLIYGAFNSIKAFNFGTYVCGEGGQVYIYNKNMWESISGSLAETIIDTDKTVKEDLLDLDKEYHGYLTSLYSINGLSANELYVCGSKKGRGFVAVFDGNDWSEISINTPSTLNHISICPKTRDMIICGEYGTLLRGNRHSDFKNLKNMTINSTFYSSDFYQDTLYIASEDGLYTYKDNVFKKVEAVENIKATFHVEEKDGVLWVLAEKFLIRFDGKHWEIIEHPDNTNDNEEKNEILKCHAGEICPRSGNWYSHANQMQKRYFSEGEIMPEIENNAWGKTIWYMDI